MGDSKQSNASLTEMESLAVGDEDSTENDSMINNGLNRNDSGNATIVRLIKDETPVKESPPVHLNLQDIIEIRIWKKATIRLRKHLIPLRVAQFLWFGCSRLFIPFFTLVLKQRGLTLTDISIVFTIVLPLQLAFGYVSGIVADKLGNAKPVLLFLMLTATTLFITILCAPNVNESCTLSSINQTCFNMLENSTNWDYCNFTCTENSSLLLNVTSVEEYKMSTNTFTLNITSGDNDDKKIYQDSVSSNPCSESCSCLSEAKQKCSMSPGTYLKVIYWLIVSLFYSSWSTSYRLLDFISLALGDEHKSNFAYERTFAMLGQLFTTVIAAFILNVDKTQKNNNYDNIYWTSVAFQLVALISVFSIKPVRFPHGQNLLKKSMKFLKDTEIMSFLVVVFVAGNGFSFFVFYTYWFLDSLKPPKALYGFHLMTRPVYGLPLYLTSKWWLRKTEPKKMFVLGLLGYVVCATCYSFLHNPWLCLLIELTNVITYHSFWISVVVHGRKIAPEGLAATLISVVGTVHFGVARSSSVAIGGYLIGTYGARTSYRIIAGMCLITAVIYAVFLVLRKQFCLETRSGSESYETESVKNKTEAEV